MMKCNECYRYFNFCGYGSGVCEPCWCRITRRDPIRNYQYVEPNLFNQDEIDKCDKQFILDEQELKKWKDNFPYGKHHEK